MPGCGKSTVGEALAEILGYSFVDMDREIEKETGKSIAKIFEEQGEKHFRFLENQFLKMIVEQDHKVIATGGGVPIFNDNMQLINSTGVSIYLKTTIENLLHNMGDKIQERPLLKTENPEKTLSDLLESRKNFYEQANHVVESNSTPRLIALGIAEILRS